MWDYNYLIKLELGSGIVSTASLPDTRNVIERIYKAPPAKDARLLIQRIKEIRDKLGSKKVLLPAIQLTKNVELDYNEIFCYWGITPMRFHIKSLQDLYGFIESKAIEYNPENWSKEYASGLLASSVNLMREGNVQVAYENYQQAYYLSRIQGYNNECIRSLAEVSCILASSGEIHLATSYAKTASTLSLDANIVDASLKCQTQLNLANILLAQNNVKGACKCYYTCAQMAYRCDNSSVQLLSLICIAECLALMGDAQNAIQYYKSALSLINQEDPRYMSVANSIYREMIKLYEHLLTFKDRAIHELEQHDIRNYFGKLIRFVAEKIFNGLLDYALYKTYNIQGTVALFSFGTNYNIKDNHVINSVLNLGNENNIINK